MATKYTPTLVPTVELLARAIAAMDLQETINAENAKNNGVGNGDMWITYNPKTTLIDSFLPAKKDAQLSLIVRDADRQLAQQAMDFINQNLTLEALTRGKVTGFMGSVYEVLQEAECNLHFRAGLMIHVPKVYKDMQARSKKRETTAEYAASSQFIGKEGATVEIDFNLISKNYIQSLGCYAAFGHDGNGNLVSFLTKHDSLLKNGHFRAKVRGHKADQYHNGANVTSLNYVKEIK